MQNGDRAIMWVIVGLLVLAIFLGIGLGGFISLVHDLMTPTK